MPTAEAPYHRIANDIAAKIKSGELKPGDKLPSTREIAESYNVHMNTVSRALSLLHDRKLITGQPGRGTFVAERTDGQHLVERAEAGGHSFE
ncbi:hypothetical protein GCM10011608_15820 [Micromonospora sonchi]|uniref:HTH gntR-type domain-containing protein n=1 Tax=Micromonospora sonchi TaxID=1763543 RepID=A0A917WTZ0_9ACTN|nr:winged helix-turn-helix domain-containing protein [Micromonospora sonchi]GGM32138.1 hypothetical protein GCM10011608_15820 [Micromonospora sonchi]